MSDLDRVVEPVLPPDEVLPLIFVEKIHSDILRDKGSKLAAAFSRLMVFETLPDGETAKNLHDYLILRNDYFSQMCAHKLEMTESG